MKSLQFGVMSNALASHLVKDFMFIRGYFQSYFIIHIRRQGNHVAHALARDARSSFPLRVWSAVVPPKIFSLVLKDMPI